MTTLHWQMREILSDLQKEGRLNVLIAMILRANIRLRCYPALDTLVDDTGLSIATVNAAKNWLVENKFIVIVPFKKRVDDELKLNSRHNVYQLTGVCRVDGKEYQYLYMTPEALEELKSRVLNTMDSKVLPVKTLDSKTLTGKDKGTSSSKGISKKKQDDTQYALLHTFKSLTGSIVPVENETKRWQDEGKKAATLLIQHGITPESLATFYQSEYKGTYKPSTLMELARKISDKPQETSPNGSKVLEQVNSWNVREQ